MKASDFKRLLATELKPGRVYLLWFSDERTQGPYRVLMTQVVLNYHWVEVFFTLATTNPTPDQRWSLRLYGQEDDTAWFSNLPELEHVVYNPDDS